MGLLDGITIADVTNGMAGPYATAILADMGANVIKVEDVPNGDFVRWTPLDALGVLPPCSINYAFECLNRNKRSIGVDLRKAAGREVISRLVKQSDIFICNFRRKTLEEWGMDYQNLDRLNPRIIYALVSGYGANGPDKDLPAFDLTTQARGGLLSSIGEKDSPPAPWGVPMLGDSLGGILLVLGVVIALFARERTGLGQEVHTSLLAGQIAAGRLLLNAYLFTGQEPRRTSRKTAKNPLRNSYQAKDGKWFSLNMSVSSRYWRRFCQAIGMSELASDPRFERDEERWQHAPELISILDRVFATKERSEWSEIMAKNDLVFAPIQNYAELAADPQVVENGYVTSFDHPTYGLIKEVGTLIDFGKTASSNKPKAAPEYGQHTEDVMLGLGYTRQEIGKLKEEGAVR